MSKITITEEKVKFKKLYINKFIEDNSKISYYPYVGELTAVICLLTNFIVSCSREYLETFLMNNHAMIIAMAIIPLEGGQK